MVEGAPAHAERTILEQNVLGEWDRNDGKTMANEEDDEVSYTRVGRCGVEGD